MTGQSDWSHARNVLCVRLDNMGDLLMTTPAIRALKRSLGRPRITLLVSRSGARLAPFLPDVDATIAYDAAWLKNDSSGNRRDLEMIDELRRRRFDGAVIFTVYSQSALPAAAMCHLAGIPLTLAHNRENPYRLLSDWVRDTEPAGGIRHEVRRQLDLVGAINAHATDARLSFRTRQCDDESMLAGVRAKGVTSTRGWIVAHCGASAASRRYDAGKFAQALKRLSGQRRPILLTGSPEERPLTAKITELAGWGAGLVDLAGCLELGELACLIDRADLLISNNTGPVHLAAALQTPVVDIYALTNPQHTPWQVPHRVLYHDVPCKYCYRSECPEGHHACLSGVSPDAVVQAAIQLLNDRDSPRLDSGTATASVAQAWPVLR